MQIELKESGGIANLNRRLELDDARVRIFDRGQVTADGEVEQATLEKVRQLAAQLVGPELRRRYGGRDKARMISDPMRLRLRIELDPGVCREFEVRTDPSDPPPEAISRLIQTLYGLLHVQGKRASKS